MTAAGEMPKAYGGREQAYIKHELLKSYLLKLFMIIGMSARRNGHVELCYVDCFAGPWRDESEKMETTSIAISLQTLDSCRIKLGEMGIAATIRALYVEKNAESFARLSTYLANYTPPKIKAEALHGDFVMLRDQILRWAAHDAFAFFFIDPKGWKPVCIDVLRPVLERPRSEYLVNFMYDFVNRTMSMEAWQEDMRQLVGEAIQLEGLNPTQRERLILHTYRGNLKKCLRARRDFRPRTAYVRVLDPTKERPKYHLVYVTMHPRGIVEFMRISETVDVVQKRVRADQKFARQQTPGIDDMFGVGTQVDSSAGHADAADVDRFWLAYLEAGMRRVGWDEFGDILEETNWFPVDLQSSLARLIKAGRVRNLDASGSRPKKPLHYENDGGERLERVENTA